MSARVLFLALSAVHTAALLSPHPTLLGARPIALQNFASARHPPLATSAARLPLPPLPRVRRALAALGVVAAGVLAPVGAALGSTASLGSAPFINRVLYTLKRNLIKNSGVAVFVFFLSAVLVGGWLWTRVDPDESPDLGEGAFRAYSLLNDIPGADAAATNTVWQRLVASGLHLVGVFTFAVVLGIVSDGISTRAESIAQSNARVVDARHTVLVNWGEYSMPVLRQLAAARREGRLSGRVVVLAGADKEEMDEALAEDDEVKGTLDVVTRHGTPTDLADMQRVSAGTAKRIIVVPTAGGYADDDAYAAEVRRATSLMQGLQQNVEGKRERRADVVVSAPTGAPRAAGMEAEELGFSSYAEVQPKGFVSRLVAQCAVQPGLSRVYEELLSQGEGAEFYVEHLHRFPALRKEGATFDDAARYFRRSTPIGLLRATTDELILAPPAGLALEAGDRLVFLADNRADVHKNFGGARKAAAEEAADGGSGAARKRAARRAAAAERPRARKLLLLGWNERMPSLLSEIDEMSSKGTTVTVVSNEVPAAVRSARLRYCKVRHVKGDATSAEDLTSLGIGGYDSVVVLQDGSGFVDLEAEVSAEQGARDSHSLACLLAVEEALEASEPDEAAAAAARPRIVAELGDPQMEELLHARFGGGADAADLVLPHELASGALVQFALQPELQRVYGELLSADGKELFLAEPSAYAESGDDDADAAPLSYATLAERARARGEVAIGVQRGDDLELNPRARRQKSLRLGPEDKLVVLGQCF